MNKKEYKLSEKTKQKISKTLMGRILSKQHKENISKSMKKNTNRVVYSKEMKNNGLLITWRSIKNKCYNPKIKEYKYYGNRDIVMCDVWKDSCLSFCQDILNVLGPKPDKNATLDRIDNDGIYKIENMRWADKTVQGLNRKICGRKPFIEGIFTTKKGYEYLVIITTNHYCRCIARTKTKIEAKEISRDVFKIN